MITKDPKIKKLWNDALDVDTTLNWIENDFRKIIIGITKSLLIVFSYFLLKSPSYKQVNTDFTGKGLTGLGMFFRKMSRFLILSKHSTSIDTNQIQDRSVLLKKFSPILEHVKSRILQRWHDCNFSANTAAVTTHVHFLHGI